MPQITMGSNWEETLWGHLGPKSNVNTPKIMYIGAPFLPLLQEDKDLAM